MQPEEFGIGEREPRIGGCERDNVVEWQKREKTDFRVQRTDSVGINLRGNQRAFKRNYALSTHCNFFKPQTEVIKQLMQPPIHRKSVLKVMNVRTLELSENIDRPEALDDSPDISRVFALKCVKRLKGYNK